MISQQSNFFPFAGRWASEVALLSQASVGEFTRPLDPMLAEGEFFKYLRDKAAPMAIIDGGTGIATLPIYGALAYRPSAFELITGLAEDSRRIAEILHSLAGSSGVSGVVLDVDSPGGFVTGGPEMARAVRALTEIKPVVCWSGGKLCSLAYMFGSQASHIMTTESALVGSIGAMSVFTDVSRLTKNVGIEVQVFSDSGSTDKGKGVSGTSLESADEAKIKAGLDKTAEMFRAMVRGVRQDVKEEAMRGQVFYGLEALSLGLVDSLGTLADAQAFCASLTRIGNPIVTLPAK